MHGYAQERCTHMLDITIVLDNGIRHTATLPYDGATDVRVSIACPHGCERKVVLGHALPLKVRGTGIEHTSHDTYFAGAIALCCKRRIGTIETRMATIFGIEEDSRVLAGPWKVY
jgi:hypothetical protein